MVRGSANPLTTNPRVLLCTAYRRHNGDYADIIGTNIMLKPRFGYHRKINFGLRFLKQNVPEVEILEYPLWEEYVDKLREGWDVVGFSGFQNEIGLILEMADEARRQGVAELWAGGYIALDPVIKANMDRIVLGYGEKFLASVYGRKLANLKHPFISMVYHIVPTGLRYKVCGVLHTQRGCPFKCTFCQTPSLEAGLSTVPLDAVERSIQFYASKGINEIIVVDELFGMFADHCNRLAEMLGRYKMRWWIQTRASTFIRKASYWHKHGLALASIGVESVDPGVLQRLNKKCGLDDIKHAVELGRKLNIFMVGFYMIGDEHATVETLNEEFKKLYNLGFHIHQLCVLTPFPSTPLWDYIDDKYGIFKTEYELFNAKDLTWNHPNISRREMKCLFRWGSGIINRPLGHYGQGILRMALRRLKSSNIRFIPQHLVKPFVHAHRFDERVFVHIPSQKPAALPEKPHRPGRTRRKQSVGLPS